MPPGHLEEGGQGPLAQLGGGSGVLKVHIELEGPQGLETVGELDGVEHFDEPGGLHAEFELRLGKGQEGDGAERTCSVEADGGVGILEGDLKWCGDGGLVWSVAGQVGGDGTFLRAGGVAEHFQDGVEVNLRQAEEALLGDAAGKIFHEGMAGGKVFLQVSGCRSPRQSGGEIGIGGFDLLRKGQGFVAGGGADLEGQGASFFDACVKDDLALVAAIGLEPGAEYAVEFFYPLFGLALRFGEGLAGPDAERVEDLAGRDPPVSIDFDDADPRLGECGRGNQEQEDQALHDTVLEAPVAEAVAAKARAGDGPVGDMQQSGTRRNKRWWHLGDLTQ